MMHGPINIRLVHFHVYFIFSPLESAVHLSLENHDKIHIGFGPLMVASIDIRKIRVTLRGHELRSNRYIYP